MPSPDLPALLDRYASMPERLRAAIRGLTEQQLDTRPSKTGWSIRQTAVRALDAELHFQAMARRLLAEPGGTLVLYDATQWVESLTPLTPLPEALEAVAALRALGVAVFDQLREVQWLHNAEAEGGTAHTLAALLEAATADGEARVAEIMVMRRAHAW